MPVKEGDLVLVNYSIWVLEDGKKELIETTVEEVAKKENKYSEKKSYGPHPILIGRSVLIPAIDKVIREMEEGEKRKIIAEPKDAFGEYNKNLVVRVPIKRLRAAGIRPVVGEEVTLDDGRKGRIIRVTERFAYIDFNHPLAGKKLEIEVEVVKVLREDPERIKYLAVRWFNVKPEDIEVRAIEGEEGAYEVTLPAPILVIRNLEAVVTNYLRDVYDMTSAKKIVLKIPVEFRREEPAPEKVGETETGETAGGSSAAEASGEVKGEEAEAESSEAEAREQ